MVELAHPVRDPILDETQSASALDTNGRTRLTTLRLGPQRLVIRGELGDQTVSISAPIDVTAGEQVWTYRLETASVTGRFVSTERYAFLHQDGETRIQSTLPRDDDDTFVVRLPVGAGHFLHGNTPIDISGEIPPEGRTGVVLP